MKNNLHLIESLFTACEILFPYVYFMSKPENFLSFGPGLFRSMLFLPSFYCGVLLLYLKKSVPFFML